MHKYSPSRTAAPPLLNVLDIEMINTVNRIRKINMNHTDIKKQIKRNLKNKNQKQNQLTNKIKIKKQHKHSWLN